MSGPSRPRRSGQTVPCCPSAACSRSPFDRGEPFRGRKLYSLTVVTLVASAASAFCARATGSTEHHWNGLFRPFGLWSKDVGPVDGKRYQTRTTTAIQRRRELSVVLPSDFSFAIGLPAHYPRNTASVSPGAWRRAFASGRRPLAHRATRDLACSSGLKSGSTSFINWTSRVSWLRLLLLDHAVSDRRKE